MAITPEQIATGLASLTPSDVKKSVPKKVKPLIEPSTTTTTTDIKPEITTVKPLAPKQNIMSPSLQVQAGIQAQTDYKSIANDKEKLAFKRMMDDGLDPKLASETLKYAIDRRLTQENNARGQEPKKYVMTPEMFQAEQNQGVKNIVGAALDTATGLPRLAGQVLGKGAEYIASGLGATDTAQRISKATEKTFGKEGTDIGQDVNAMSYKAPKMIGDIASVASIGGSVSKIPMVASNVSKLGALGNAGKIAVGALEGAGGQALYSAQSEQRLPTAGELALGAGVGGTIPALGIAYKGAKKVLPKIADKADDAANKMLTNMNRITKGEQEKFAVQQGKTVGEWMNSKGLVSGGDESIEALAKGFKASKDKADEGLSLIKGEYKNDYLSTMAREASEFADNTLSPQASKMKELADKADNLGLTMPETNEVKRFFERNNKFTYGRDITAGEKTVRATNLDNYVRNRQLDIAEQNGFGNLKEINKDTQGYKYLLDKLIKNENGRLGNNAVTLTDWIVAGEVAANPQAIALLVGKKVASSNWFRKGVVKILNKIGNAKSEADRLVDIAKIQRIQNEKDLTKFLSLPYKKDANIPTYSLNSSNSVKGVVRPITPSGVIQETSPVLPKATIIPKKKIVEKGRATHNPYAPKVEPVKTPVPVAPVKTYEKELGILKNDKTLDDVMNKIDESDNKTPVTTTNTTAPKKQSVLLKPQEKQAVLEGKKEVKYNNQQIDLMASELSERFKMNKDIIKNWINSENPNFGEISLAIGKRDENYLRNMQEKIFMSTEKKSPIPTPKAPVSKELQPLYEEAKKYKTADEFIDNAVKNTDETKGKFLTDDFIGAENKEFSSSMRTEGAKETSKKFKNNEPVEITINQYGEINHGDGHHRAYNGFILGEKIPVKIVKSRLKGEELKKYILLRNAGYKKIRNSTYPGSFSDALESKFKEYSTQLRKIREEAQRQ